MSNSQIRRAIGGRTCCQAGLARRGRTGADSAGPLLVLPNNPGYPSEDLALLRAAATCELRNALKTANDLDAAVLVPLFPRPWRFNLQALTRESLKRSWCPGSGASTGSSSQ